MAFKMPERKYFTFPELIQRWKCDENDLRRMILDRELIPSYVINESALVVNFEFSCPDLPEYESGYWSPEIVKYDDLHGELEEVGSAKLVDADGFYYLLHPWQRTSLNCTFVYFSTNRGHQKDSGETCFMLHRQEPLSLDEVMKSGVAMADEVFRLERRDNYLLDTSNVGKSEIGARERTTYLNIIGAMLELLQSSKPGRESAAAVIRELVDNYGDRPGISKSNLELKFTDAVRSIRAT